MGCKPKKNSLRMADGGEAVTRWAGNPAGIRFQDGGRLRGNPVGEYMRRVGEEWSRSNADFEGGNPGVMQRVGRAVNPLTGFGSSVGAMYDAAGSGDVTGMALAAGSSIPAFAAMRTAKTVAGPLRAASTGGTAVRAGQNTAFGVGADYYTPGLQDGGTVPGSGTGDKIPAKYEPGEFVVSNDMIDDNPGLREQLSGLRAETLAARGKTVAEADAGAVKHGSLRAADGVWAPTNPFFDTFGVASRRGMHASGVLEAQADAQRALTASQNAARAQTLAADAASAAQAENAAVRAALNTASPVGAPPAPAPLPPQPQPQPQPEPRPAPPAPPRTGIRGTFDTAKGYAGRMGDVVKSAGPTLAAGAAGATAAHLARDIGNPGSADGPGQAASANVAQIPTGGYAAAPPKQAYNTFTDTEVGRNVGNLVSAASVIPGLNVMRVPLAGAQAAAMSARAAAGVAALQGAANTIRHDRAATSAPSLPAAAPATAEPQTQPQAQPQAQPVAPQPTPRSGFDGFTAPVQAQEDAPIMVAPSIRHSGNDWEARNNLRNLAVSASSIDQRRPRGGVSAAEAAYLDALKHDTNLKGGNTLAEAAGIKAASEANTSRNSLRSYADTASKHLLGAQVPLQVEGMRMQMQRNTMGAMQQIMATHTDPKTGQVDTVKAADAARRAGLTNIADDLDKASASRQGLAAKGQEMSRSQADHFRKTFFAGKFNDANIGKDGNVDVKRTEALEQEAATMALGMYPNLARMPDAARNAAINEVLGTVGLAKKLGRVERGGFTGVLPDILSGQQQFAPTSTMRGDDFFRGAEPGTPYGGIAGVLSPDYEKGDYSMKLSGGRGYARLPQLTEHEKAALARQIAAANATPTIRAK